MDLSMGAEGRRIAGRDRDHHQGARCGAHIEQFFAVEAPFRFRDGLFFELKVGVIDSPDVKLTVGYTIR